MDGTQEAKLENLEKEASAVDCVDLIVADGSQHELSAAEDVITIQESIANTPIARPEAYVIDDFHLLGENTGEEAPAKYDDTLDTNSWVIGVPVKDISDPTIAETVFQGAENIAILESNSESVTEGTSSVTEEVQHPVVEGLKTADEQQSPSAEEPALALEQAVTEASISIIERPSLMPEENPMETPIEHITALEGPAASTSPVIEVQTPTIKQSTISEIEPTLGAEEHSAENMSTKEESVIEAASLAIGDLDIPDIQTFSIDALPVEDTMVSQEPIIGTETEGASDNETSRAEELQTTTAPIQQLVSEEPMTEADPATEKIPLNAALSTPEEYQPQQSFIEGEVVQECTSEVVPMPTGELSTEVPPMEPVTEIVISAIPDAEGAVEERTIEAVAMPPMVELPIEVPSMVPMTEAVTTTTPDTQEAVEEDTTEAVAMPPTSELPTEMPPMTGVVTSVTQESFTEECAIEEPTIEAVVMFPIDEISPPVQQGIVEPVIEVVAFKKLDIQEPPTEGGVFEGTLEHVVVPSIAAEESLVQEASSDLEAPSTERAVAEYIPEPVAVLSIIAEEFPMQVASSEELDIQAPSTENIVEDHTPEPVVVSSVVAEEFPMQVVSFEELGLQAVSTEDSVEEHTPEPAVVSSVVAEEFPMQVVSFEELGLQAPSTEGAVEEYTPEPIVVSSVTEEESLMQIASSGEPDLQVSPTEEVIEEHVQPQALEPTTEVVLPQEASQEPSEFSVEDRAIDEHIPQPVTAFDVGALTMPLIDGFIEGLPVQQAVLEPGTEVETPEQSIEEHPLPAEQTVVEKPTAEFVTTAMEEYRDEENSEPVGAESLSVESEASIHNVQLHEQEMAIASDLIPPETVDVEVVSTEGEPLDRAEVASEVVPGNLEVSISEIFAATYINCNQ